ncbi:HAD family hydrolase [Acrocarpospora corrugata]|nr:HAD family hydrolase [Acrocarpospora corrugata]
MRPVDPVAIVALRRLHTAGLRLVLASNTKTEQDRRLALRRAGIEDVFKVVLQSAQLGVAKPAPIFYRMVIAAAGCAPERILFVGDNMAGDVVGPLGQGMSAALVRPDGLGPGEVLPGGAKMIRHVREVGFPGHNGDHH